MGPRYLQQSGSSLVLLVLCLAGLWGGISRADEAFPEWPELEPQVRFWVDVYTRYDTRQAIIHDEWHPHVVYGVLSLGGAPDGGETEFPVTDREIMRLAGEQVTDVLRSLQGSPERQTSSLEASVLAGYAALPDDEARARAPGRVRVQRGQADRFRLGLIRSGQYLQTFRAMAHEAGLPGDLAYLPHVESAFDSRARSGAGAAGMWQLMRPTARAYMTIDTHRDERLDPWLAAEAAYAYLQEAYAMLGSWPLALTAYNHGPYGMRRAQKQFGNDLPALIRGYRSRSFGFASRNFYAEFLAARRVAEQPEHWFGPLPAAATLEVQQVTLSEWVTVDALTAFLGLDVPLLRQLNPALEEVVWTELGMVPEGYGLNLPRASALRLSEGWQGLPVEARYRRVAHVDWAVVREGDSLGLIARRHGTSVNRLRALNGLHRRRYIYPGERLKVSQTQRFVALSQLTGAGEPLHVVRRGETLSHIGERYGIRVADLITANGIRDASRLMAGQVLVLPGVR